MRDRLVTFGPISPQSYPNDLTPKGRPNRDRKGSAHPNFEANDIALLLHFAAFRSGAFAAHGPEFRGSLLSGHGRLPDKLRLTVEPPRPWEIGDLEAYKEH